MNILDFFRKRVPASLPVTPPPLSTPHTPTIDRVLVPDRDAINQVIAKLDALALEHDSWVFKAKQKGNVNDIVVHTRLSEYCNTLATQLRDVLETTTV